TLLDCPRHLFCRSAPPLSASRFSFYSSVAPPDLHSFPTRRSSDLRNRGGAVHQLAGRLQDGCAALRSESVHTHQQAPHSHLEDRSEEHTSELQSLRHLVCRLLLEKKKKNNAQNTPRTAQGSDTG